MEFVSKAYREGQRSGKFGDNPYCSNSHEFNEFESGVKLRISVNPIGRFGFIRSLFHLLFRPCQFYLK